VVCEQVHEHVPNLLAAVWKLFALCRPGEFLLVSTPFCVRIHVTPDELLAIDIKNGLRQLLKQGGFHVMWVRSWGNRSCVRRNLRRWLPYRSWRSLRNDTETPMVAWALARRREDRA